MPISVAEGNRRPHDLVQAAKFASEARCSSQASNTNFDTLETLQEALQCRPLEEFCGHANCMYGYPLLTFNSDLSNFNGFTFHSHYCVQSRLDINKAHPPTQEACWNVLQSGVQQACYRLKQTNFNGIPANKIPTTSLVSSMSNAQWCEFVEIWSSAKNKVCVNPSISCLVLLWSTCATV